MSQWSYSGLKQFQNCPKQYHEMRVLKNFEQQDNDNTTYGKDVHKALELYVRDDEPLPKNYLRFAPAVDALKAIPGTKYCELQMGLKEDRVTACAFDDPEYWVHGIADLAIIAPPLGFLVDYKTGKSQYADLTQLRLMAIMLFAWFPDVMTIRSGLLFLANNLFIPEEYERKDIPGMWVAFSNPLRRLALSQQTGQWPANPTGLCKKHCPVVTCRHHGQ